MKSARRINISGDANKSVIVRHRDLIAIWSTDGDFKKISEISGYFSTYHFSPDGNIG
jgi:hypothetical protein